MIAAQIATWIFLSVVSGIIAYFIITEGKSKLLLTICVSFNLSVGVIMSYLWLQMTDGLELFSPQLIYLPLLIACIGTIVLLTFYKIFYPRAAFPRRYSLKVKRYHAMIALGVVIVISMMVAVTSFPGPEAVPSIAILSSTEVPILDVQDILGAVDRLERLDSSMVMIQKSVISPTSLKDDPKQGEYMNFKVTVDLKPEYIQPVVKVLVHDPQMRLLPMENIVMFPQETGNEVRGQIYCDEPGTFMITAVVYDVAIDAKDPVVANTLSYTVAAEEIVERGEMEPENFVIILSVVLLLGFLWLCFAVSLFRRM